MGKQSSNYHQLNNSEMEVSSISYKEATANITPMSYLNGSQVIKQQTESRFENDTSLAEAPEN